MFLFFFFSSRRRHTRFSRDWSSDVCSSDLQRGVLNLAHDQGDVRSSLRRVNANALNGVDAEWLTPAEVAEFCPIVNVSPDVRYPVLGATLQRRGGTARHDRVAWGFATAADRLGVDVVEHCEVTGFVRGEGGRV